MRTQWLGQLDYVKSLELQNFSISIAESDPVIWGVEHPTTITLGRRGDPLKDVVIGFKGLREKNIPVVAVERGGQATLHNPGQLVVYPILSLPSFGLGVKDYVSLLEEVTKKLLNSYGITACCKGDEPGLFTIKGKIAFYGVRVSRGVTSHGLALNITNDLSDFSMIRSCGKASEHFSKLADFIDPVPSLEALFSDWSQLFLKELATISKPLTPESTPGNLKPEIVLT